MSYPALPRQLRSVLEGAPDALSLSDLLVLVDEFVLECSSSEEAESLIAQLEEDLQILHHDVFDYSSLYQNEVFLAVLYHLGPILPYNSILAWFELVLRPALREPKLPTQAVDYAKELIITALQKTNEQYADKVGDFRRRLLEFYLLDAFNEGSGDDVLEWAELSSEERQKRTHWKYNLEDILIRFGNERPEDLLNEIDKHFAVPSSRLQLFILLTSFTTVPDFYKVAQILPQHPLMLHILYSLFLDYSSTVCMHGVTLMVKLLPYIAVYARKDLKDMLPKLLAVLARIMCWKERRAAKAVTLDDNVDVDFERELEQERNRVLPIAPDIQWERLEMVFSATISPPPQSRPYFTILYYLYPSNVLKFLRNPVQYLTDSGLRSPYTEPWASALDQDEIRRRSENLVREHNCHPLLIWRDAVVELDETEFWSKYELSRIVSEAPMLDIRNLAVGIHARYRYGTQTTNKLAPSSTEGIPAEQISESLQSPQFLRPIDLSSGKAVISLQDMIDTTIALKSNLDIEVVQPSSSWASTVYANSSPPTATLGPTNSPLPALTEEDNASHVAQAISGLQREVLLLRNELNFELWLSRENAKHIARLYQDRILMRTAEAERQGLYNKLRKYRAQVNSLESELREHRQRASTDKNKYADWNTELVKKLKEFREEKKNWNLEAAALRKKEKETQALFSAQTGLLADATKEVFDLQTQKKENQHKVDRLHDYERQIERLLEVQKLWRVSTIPSKWLAYPSDEAGKYGKAYRRQIQTMETRMKLQQRQASNPRAAYAQEIAKFASEKGYLTEANEQLREENQNLKEEVEELQAMMAILKGQLGGHHGLTSEPRASPVAVHF
ncbi:hypothetical protein CVT24_008378 [Panaeolus cyanescens]|uniref:Tuberous sclerosis 1 n=1 Tax=Panaeolus cyanescens TaxID=181874 RepID=A0A409W0S3_9AGAR|nr:hypothetical protein CVT24_008378 [Panaeolus cyanescens]